MRISYSLILFLTVFALIGTSCKKGTTDYKCTTCASGPAAIAANDQSAKGVYKGTIVGSTGTLLINIANTDSTVTAVLTLDGQTVTLSATGPYMAGQPFYGTFSGTVAGQQASFTLTVDADGSDPAITAINIPGHTGAVIIVYKELSASQIMCYEGTYTGQNSGVFNMIINTGANTWKTIAKDDNDNTGTVVSGTVSGTAVSCSSCIGGAVGSSVSGSISGDNISGSWSDGQGSSGTWTCHRTL